MEHALERAARRFSALGLPDDVAAEQEKALFERAFGIELSFELLA